MSEWEKALERIMFRTLPPHPVEDAAIIRAEVERLRIALGEYHLQVEGLKRALETWVEAADHPNGFIRRALEGSRVALEGVK